MPVLASSRRRGSAGPDAAAASPPACGRCRSAADLRDHVPARCSATATSCRRRAAHRHVHRRTPRWRSRPRTCRPRPSVDPIVGESEIHTLDDLQAQRDRRRSRSGSPSASSSSYFRDDDGDEQPWLFPQLLRDRARAGWTSASTLQGQHVPAAAAARRVRRRRGRAHLPRDRARPTDGEQRLMPILRPYDPIGSTALRRLRHDQDASCPPSPSKCHVSDVVADSGWEQKVAERLEEMAEVRAYVKNQDLGFTIPYTLDGEPRELRPRLHRPHRRRPRRDDLLNLIVEVSGAGARRTRQAKVRRPRELSGCRRVNNHGELRPLGVPRGRRPVGRASRRSATSSARRARSRAGMTPPKGHEEQDGRADAGRGDPPQGQAGEHPDRGAARLRRRRGEAPEADALPARPVARPAARLEGQGRAGRPGPRGARRCRSTSRRRSTRRRSSRTCATTAAAGEPEPELDLFADFNGIDVRGAGRLLPARPATGRTA